MRLLNNPFLYLVTVFLLTSLSCNSPADGKAAANAMPVAPYFSLADYFNQEATRLQQINPEIVKTVSKNGDEEQRKIRVANWKEEFALFIDADINKSAWQHSYRVDSTSTSLTYTSIDSTLRTKAIRLEKSETGAVIHVRVTNRVNNMLYQTDEQLDYYVDSLYRIIKAQHVRIIGKSHYTVTGKWL